MLLYSTYNSWSIKKLTFTTRNLTSLDTAKNITRRFITLGIIQLQALHLRRWFIAVIIVSSRTIVQRSVKSTLWSAPWTHGHHGFECKLIWEFYPPRHATNPNTIMQLKWENFNHVLSSDFGDARSIVQWNLSITALRITDTSVIRTVD